MTPREILLNQHRDAEPKLDGLRQNITNELRRAQSPRAFHPWKEPQLWLGSGKWRFLALAGAWCTVILLQVASEGAAPNAPRSSGSLTPRQLSANVRENRRYLLDTLDFSVKTAAAPAVPAPRSALQLSLFNS